MGRSDPRRISCGRTGSDRNRDCPRNHRHCDRREGARSPFSRHRQFPALAVDSVRAAGAPQQHRVAPLALLRRRSSLTQPVCRLRSPPHRLLHLPTRRRKETPAWHQSLWNDPSQHLHSGTDRALLWPGHGDRRPRAGRLAISARDLSRRAAGLSAGGCSLWLPPRRSAFCDLCVRHRTQGGWTLPRCLSSAQSHHLHGRRPLLDRTPGVDAALRYALYSDQAAALAAAGSRSFSRLQAVQLPGAPACRNPPPALRVESLFAASRRIGRHRHCDPASVRKVQLPSALARPRTLSSGTATSPGRAQFRHRLSALHEDWPVAPASLPRLDRTARH